MNKLPTGVCRDKERGKFRATYKGWSIRCDTLQKAIEKRAELVKDKVAHPTYVLRQKVRGYLAQGKTVQISKDGVVTKAFFPK